MQWEAGTPVGLPVCMRHNDCRLKKMSQPFDSAWALNNSRRVVINTTYCYLTAVGQRLVLDKTFTTGGSSVTSRGWPQATGIWPVTASPESHQRGPSC